MTTYKQFLEGNTNIKEVENLVIGFRVDAEKDGCFYATRYAIHNNGSAMVSETVYSSSRLGMNDPQLDWFNMAPEQIPLEAEYIGHYPTKHIF